MATQEIACIFCGNACSKSKQPRVICRGCGKTFSFADIGKRAAEDPLGIGELKFISRSFFEKIYKSGASHREIAQMLGMTANQVLHYARGIERDKALAKMGERSNRAKVSDVQIVEILLAHEAGLALVDIAPKYALSESHVREILQGKVRCDFPEAREILLRHPYTPQRKRRRKQVKKKVEFVLHHASNPFEKSATHPPAVPYKKDCKMNFL